MSTEARLFRIAYRATHNPETTHPAFFTKHCSQDFWHAVETVYTAVVLDHRHAWTEDELIDALTVHLAQRHLPSVASVLWVGERTAHRRGPLDRPRSDREHRQLTALRRDWTATCGW